MPKLKFQFPAWIWQMLLMSLLGLSGIVFVPVLLRWANPQLMATVMVAQAYVYYLVLLVQYGFAFSGPAAVARAADATGVVQVLRSSVHGKLLLLGGPVAVAFGLGYVCLAWGQWYVWVFFALLGAYAINSNWWLQTQQRFGPAVGLAAFGVVVSALIVYALVGDYVGSSTTTQGAWIVFALVLPQIFTGVGTWWVARKVCGNLITVASDGATYVANQLVNSANNLSWLRTDGPLVTSQLLLLASTTLGTVVVGGLADADTTAAYAATEKLFNLGATLLVGLYMAVYPRFAAWFYSDRTVYWKKTKQLVLAALLASVGLAALLNVVGPWFMAVYLPKHLAQKVVPVLLPFALWLGMCISQHVLTSYLVLAERNSRVLWINACVLAITVLVGYAFALNNPVDWVYGMVAGQVLALVLLLQLYREDRAAHL